MALVLFTANWESLKKVITNRYFILFTTFFLLSLLSTLWSEDVRSAFKYVELRLLLVLFPFIFCSTDLKVKHSREILFVFITGLFTAALVGFANSYYDYHSTLDTGYFFNDNLIDIFNKQAPYFSLYVNVALVFIVFLINGLSTVKKVFLILLGLLLCIFQLLLAVRISILALTILLIVFTIKQLITKSTTMGKVISVVSLLIVGGLVFTLPQTSNRFKSMLSNLDYQFDNPNPVNHFNGEISSENWNGLNLRLALWHCGKDIIKNNVFFGVGGGDYKAEMRSQYEIKKFIYAKEQDFGVHNQFLYSWISWGAFGLLIFLISLVYPTMAAFANRNYPYLIFLFVISISFLTENTLNRYIGVYFFGLFNSLLFFQRAK